MPAMTWSALDSESALASLTVLVMTLQVSTRTGPLTVTDGAWEAHK